MLSRDGWGVHRGLHLPPIARLSPKFTISHETFPLGGESERPLLWTGAWVSTATLQTKLRGGTDGSGREPRVLLSWKTANENPLEGEKAKGGERGHKVYKNRRQKLG